MRLQDYDTTNRYTAIVKQTTRITPEESSEEVDELVLEIDNTNFTYEIGQSIGVLVPGPHELGHDYHFRLYTITNPPQSENTDKPLIDICVKRCQYIDEYSGEEYQGIASNYLCDLQAGEQLSITGPYGIPFEIPADKASNLLMIGMGTGIAPFRAFVKHIYHTVGSWKGKVRFFYGAHTGLELLYMNDIRDDFANYYDEETFKAFKTVSARPHWQDSAALEQTLEENEEEVWGMISRENTYVYIAGLESIEHKLDKALGKMAGSQEIWQQKKADLITEKRWAEIIY